MKKKYSLILLLFLLNACSFNNVFYQPYPLNQSSRFTDYDEEKGDTLQLQFDQQLNPLFTYKSGDSLQSNFNIENIFFLNPKGDSINAWLFTPKVPSNGTTIYYLHGNAGNMVIQYQLMTPFVERGFTVFMIDYSEFGFSTGKAKRKTVLEDAYAGFDYLLERDDISKENLILYGQSLGGHLATVVAEKYDDKIDALVIEGAFSSHKDIAAVKFKFLARILVKEAYSAKDTISSITKPILVIHSTEDARVPYSHGVRLYEKATDPKSFYKIEHRHVLAPLYYADSIAFKMEEMLVQSQKLEGI